MKNQIRSTAARLDFYREQTYETVLFPVCDWAYIPKNHLCKAAVLQLSQIIFFHTGKDPIEDHGDDAQNHNGH